MTICALTMVSPYYDCNSEWDIIVYENELPIEKPNIIGRATFPNKLFGIKGTIELVGYHDKAVGKHDHLLRGGGTLYHEILHMQCKCDWHEHWDVLEEIKEKRNHSRVKIPPIPNEVRPFLNIGVI